mgnify:CR=1 FL=1
MARRSGLGKGLGALIPGDLSGPENDAALRDLPVSQIMTEIVVTCEPEATSAELMAMMTEKRIRHIPVIVEGEMVGIVSIGDVVKSRLAELETEHHAMQTYISS